MGEKTAIEWATSTWNPVIGCQKVSAACQHCYAETYATQRLQRPELWRGERHVTSASTWALPERVDRAAGRAAARARLFVASLSDVFEDHHAWSDMLPDHLAAWSERHPRSGAWPSVRHAALRKLERLTHTDVLLLTKRPQHVLRFVPGNWLEAWPQHVWIGTTVEDQATADERIPHLLRVPARVRFLSCEPLLGRIELDATLIMPIEGTTQHGQRFIDWVIAGGESGPHARPSHPAWFRSLRDQCIAAGVPFLFKQWGEWATDPHGAHPQRIGHMFPGGPEVARLGKRRAGRELDGRTWDEIPAEVPRG